METFTPNYNLSKFDQGDKPPPGTVIVGDPVYSAAKANANMTKIDTALANIYSDSEGQLKFFRDRGYIYSNIIKSGTVFPTPDFFNHDAANNGYSIVDSFMVFGTKQASNIGNFGWNLGAAYTKALFVLGGLIPETSPQDPVEGGIWISQTTPPSYAAGSKPPNAYLFKLWDRTNARTHMEKLDGSGNETIISNDAGAAPPPPDVRDTAYYLNFVGSSAPKRVNGIALQVDGATVRGWINRGVGTWEKIYEIADVTVTQFSYAGIWFKGTAGGEGQMRLVCPVMIAAQ